MEVRTWSAVRQLSYEQSSHPFLPLPAQQPFLHLTSVSEPPGLIKTHHVHSTTTERGREGKKYLILSERLSNLVNAPPPLFFITSRSPHESRIEVRSSFLTDESATCGSDRKATIIEDRCRKVNHDVAGCLRRGGRHALCRRRGEWQPGAAARSAGGHGGVGVFRPRGPPQSWQLWGRVITIPDPTPAAAAVDPATDAVAATALTAGT